MSRQATTSKATAQHVILFIAGDSPRSRRARANLASALAHADMDENRLREIDLLREPDQAIAHGLFATPALLRTDDHGPCAVLYGDLSDRDSLMRFLDDLSGTDSGSPKS